jgi:3-hydroxyacyl-CoA dehydrogenase
MKRQRAAVIGAGTIGASWAANFLARGLEVSVYDPSPGAESFTRRFIDNAWNTLQELNAVLQGASPQHITFHGDAASAVADAQFVQESGPTAPDPAGRSRWRHPDIPRSGCGCDGFLS